MLEKTQTHNKILSIIKEKGPSLPIQISKSLGMSSLFISAFLSELAGEHKLKISHLKVGGSPLYYIPGQEEQLENFKEHLNHKEEEAFSLLKQKKILKDSKQTPAIRVALRSIRDFSKGFKINEDIYWRFHTIDEKQAFDLIEKPKKVIKKTTPKIKIIKPKEKQIDFENPLIIKTKKRAKPKSQFAEKAIRLISSRYLIIDEKDYKKNEYNCIIQIKSELGNIKFLTQAKDKKTISETDIKKLLSNAQKIPLPALLIYTGNLSKKAQELAVKYSSILKTMKIN